MNIGSKAMAIGKNCYLVFFFVLIYSKIGAQNTPEKRVIYFRQGYSNIIAKDLFHSPYIYRGANAVSELGYSYKGNKAIHLFDISYTYGKLSSGFSPKAVNRMLTVDYRFLPFLFNKGKISFYAGPNIQFMKWNVDYFPEIKVSKVHSDLLTVSLKGYAGLKIKLNERSSLSAEGSLPAINYVDRPNFLNGDGRINDFGLFNILQIQGELTYQYQISDKWNLSLYYQYDYLHYKYPAHVRMMRNSFGIGLQFKL